MPRRNYQIIAIAYVSFIILGMVSAVLGVLWEPYIQTSFNQPLSALGSLLIANTIGYSVGSMLSGRLFARYPVGMMLAVGSLIGTAGFFGYIIAPSWEVMIGFGLMVGFGTGILDGGMNIYFAAHFNARLMNWLHACFGTGALLAPQIVNGLVLTLGMEWRAVYILFIALCIGVGLAFLFTNSIWLPVTEPTAQGQATPFTETLRLSVVWLGIMIFACYSGSEASAGTWAASLFKSRGIEPLIANNSVTVYWSSFTFGRIFFGAIIHLFSAENLIRGCLLGMGAGAALLWWAPSPELGLIGIALFGFMLGPIFAVLITETQRRLGSNHAPNAIGFQVAAASVGAGVLPALAGQFAEINGREIIPPFLLVLTVLMLGLYQLSLIMGYDAKKKKGAEYEYAAPIE